MVSGTGTTQALALPDSKCAHLPYPYDEGTPADRATLAALEKATWFLWCLKHEGEAARV